MIVSSSCYLQSSASSRRGGVRALSRLAQEVFVYKLFEQHLACTSVDLPQPARLGNRQLQSRHFEVLAANASDQELTVGHCVRHHSSLHRLSGRLSQPASGVEPVL